MNGRWLIGISSSAFLAVRALAATVPATGIELDNDPVLQLSLNDYVGKAITIGIQGRENQLALETAGYTREVVFRQTEAPSISLDHTRGRSQTTTDGIATLSQLQNTALTVNETTPLGTTLTASGGYGDSPVTTNGVVLTPSGEKPNAAVNATQPLYLFVKNPVLRTRRQAELSFEDAQSSFESTKLSIRTQARVNYYNVMEQEASIAVAKRKADSSRKLLDVTQALVDAGKSAPVDAMRAKISLQTDLRAVDNAQTLRNQAVFTAKNYIFLPLNQDVDFTTQLSYAAFHVSLDKLVHYALLHQPTLQTLRRAQEHAFLNWQAALETTRPSLSLNGTYNYNEYPTLFDLTSYSRGWSWTFNAQWLFFDSGVTRNQVREAEVARTVADLNLADGERTTELNVNNAYMDVKRTEKQIQDFESQREQARRNTDVLRLRFQNGLATLIDVLDAENSERDLDNEYLGLLVQFNESKDTLTQQVGTDVDTL